MNKWSSIAPQLQVILTQHYKVSKFQTDWAEEIENILLLLKMFPSGQLGRNVIASDATFKKAVEQFIQLEPVIYFFYPFQNVNKNIHIIKLSPAVI